ncbi:MAG: hypothetical protein KDA75_08700, partial [Planctomycetaceae bacterium]|nr:hypothetical protein [Planctomycetaceae bacterium]
MSAATSESVNFSELMESSPSFGQDEIRRMLGAAIGAGAVEFRRAVEQAAVSGNPTIKVRAGIGQYFLGQHQRAIDALAGCEEGIGRF